MRNEYSGPPRIDLTGRSIPTPEEFFHHLLALPPQKRYEEFGTSHEVAFWLDVSDSTIRRWKDEGRLPWTKVRGRLWIHKPTLERMLLEELVRSV